ncbi:YnfA family protein [Paracoccus pacificus]|uniref:YnfA family protein n=1 Tax=Paracoccus pacificus TaxID=1463598 RepID=A0ABW4R9H8_9RHOB
MTLPAGSLALYVVAAMAEIAGCFAFWAWLRLDRSALWLVPGTAALILFAFLLTRVDTAFAGRAYAAYGGIYVAASLVWLWLTEGQVPTRWDLLGGGICILGAVVILTGSRS